MKPTAIGRFIDTPSYEELQQKIERLRLTDEERGAIERGIGSLVGVEDVSADAGPMDDAAACTLRGLIERLA